MKKLMSMESANFFFCCITPLPSDEVIQDEVSEIMNFSIYKSDQNSQI